MHKFVERELKLKIEQKHIWLDSQCVLNWIGSKRIFTKFVENRLKEIRSDGEINFHCIVFLKILMTLLVEALRQKRLEIRIYGGMDQNGYYHLVTVGQHEKNNKTHER